MSFTSLVKCFDSLGFDVICCFDLHGDIGHVEILLSNDAQLQAVKSGIRDCATCYRTS